MQIIDRIMVGTFVAPILLKMSMIVFETRLQMQTDISTEHG